MAKIESTTVRTRKGAPTPSTPNVAPQQLKEMVKKKPGVPTSLKGVFFGPPKTQKTTVACSGGSTLLINFDPEGYAVGTLKGRKDIDVIEPKSFEEMEQVVRGIASGQADEYNFIVVDSVTFMFQKFGGKDINETYRSGKDIRRAYGQAGAAVSQIINDLCTLDRNIIFVAHLQKEFEDENTSTTSLDADLGEYAVTLAVTPMVWKILGAAVGFIGRTWKENVMDLDTGNNEPRFFVSFNDGNKSPVGSRYAMEAKYEVTPTLLSDLANELL